MKKINIVLIFLIIIMLIFIVIKIMNQEVITKKEIIGTNENEQQLQYEVEREFKYGEKSNYSEFKEDGTRVNKSEEMKKEQQLEDGVIVKDFNLEYKSGYTSVYGTVTNNSSEVKGGYYVQLVLINDEGKEVNSFTAYLNKIEPSQEGIIATSIPGDIADSYKFEVRRVQEEN